jgi:hypothetical protein
MANYNPYAPFVIGNEWVPIRQENFQPDEITERGYIFRLDNSTVIVSGSHSLYAVPPAVSDNKLLLNAIYPEGTEDLTGPIMQLTIPVEFAYVTGAGVTSPNGGAIDLKTPTDNNYITMNNLSANNGFGMQFSAATYNSALSGKRILNMELLYVVNGDPVDLAFLQFGIARRTVAVASRFVYQQGAQGTPTGVPSNVVASVPFKDLNPFWNLSLWPSQTDEFFPWRNTEIQMLDDNATGGTQLIATVTWSGSSANISPIYFGYAALRVTYCEEQRVLYGSRLYPEQENDPGLKLHRFLDTSFAHGSTSLSPGRYTMTTTYRSLSNVSTAAAILGEDTTTPPTLYGVRQYYELPTLPALTVNTSKTVGDTFTKESSDNLPAILMYHAAATVTGSHAYSTQTPAPVYGSIYASQVVNGTFNSGSSATVQQVRFYARRFGPSSGNLRIRDTAGTTYAEITSAELDALPEIIDGWREVTLDFNQTLTVAVATEIFWESVSATASTRWEIIVAQGKPTEALFPWYTGVASYGTPLNGAATYIANYKEQLDSITAGDVWSDVTVLLATTPPAVTGFALSTCTLEVTGIGQGCEGVPECIPTHILGNGLSWNIGSVIDYFDRTQVDEWGSTTSGDDYTLFGSGGSVANSDWQVADGVGTMLVPAANATRTANLTDYLRQDVDASVSFLATAPIVSGAAIEPVSLLLRGTSTTVFNMAKVSVGTNSAFTLKLYNPAGSEIATQTLVEPIYEPDRWYRFKARIAGTWFAAKLWQVGEEEPSGWDITVTDSTTPVPGWVAVRAGIAASNLNAPLTFSYDDLCVIPAELTDGSVQIQRTDDVVGEWETIYAAGPCELPEFCDYEARVGMESTYRMRTVNFHGFNGAWTSEASILLASPGVSGVGDGNSTLIFTNNAAPDASLAYVMNWEGTPEESFAFPEAGFQQLRTQYGRDFFIAFRPNERGGEAFSRTILVQAAAITPESLADFKNLRNLAWADLPYICVRDELGNRWLANVAVPGGVVRRDRTLYFANIDIVEVTDTPAPYTGA